MSMCNVCRYISRVVLIPFIEERSGNAMTPVERRKADAKFSAAIDKASNGASLVIGLGSKLVGAESEFEEIVEKVTQMLPQSATYKPKQRIYTSYSLLLFATLKVISIAPMQDKPHLHSCSHTH